MLVNERLARGDVWLVHTWMATKDCVHSSWHLIPVVNGALVHFVFSDGQVHLIWRRFGGVWLRLRFDSRILLLIEPLFL